VAAEELQRGATAHEVAVVAPPGVVAVEPALELAVEVAELVEALTVERRPVELVQRDPWKRSQTALWLGDRGGVR
jgi:hypothetical protein